MKKKVVVKKPRQRKPKKFFVQGFQKTRFFKQRARHDAVNKLLVDYKFC